MKNNEQMVFGLLESGGYPDITDSFYRTPLHIATEDDNEALVRRLLKYGANPHLRDYAGLSCL